MTYIFPQFTTFNYLTAFVASLQTKILLLFFHYMLRLSVFRHQCPRYCMTPHKVELTQLAPSCVRTWRTTADTGAKNSMSPFPLDLPTVPQLSPEHLGA